MKRNSIETPDPLASPIVLFCNAAFVLGLILLFGRPYFLSGASTPDMACTASGSLWPLTSIARTAAFSSASSSLRSSARRSGHGLAGTQELHHRGIAVVEEEALSGLERTD